MSADEQRFLIGELSGDPAAAPIVILNRPAAEMLASQMYAEIGVTISPTRSLRPPRSFQKIPDHHGIVANDPIGAVARLQSGRANTLAGDTAKAKAAYRNFLTVWQDADSDMPILKVAKAEFARLQ